MCKHVGIGSICKLLNVGSDPDPDPDPESQKSVHIARLHIYNSIRVQSTPKNKAVVVSSFNRFKMCLGSSGSRSGSGLQIMMTFLSFQDEQPFLSRANQLQNKYIPS